MDVELLKASVPSQEEKIQKNNSKIEKEENKRTETKSDESEVLNSLTKDMSETSVHKSEVDKDKDKKEDKDKVEEDGDGSSTTFSIQNAIAR